MEQGSNLFYYLFPIVITFFVLVRYKKQDTGIIILLILLFLSIFRGDYVGNDTLTYMDRGRIQYRGTALDIDFSKDYILENLGNNTEFIDILLNKIVYSLDLHPRFIIIVYAFIALVVFYNALKRFKANTGLGLLLYVLSGMYYFSLSAVRQMAAVSIVVYAMSYIIKNNNITEADSSENNTKNKNNFINFIIVMFIAGFIHTSAFFYVILYPMKFIHINKKICLLILSAICLVGVIIVIDPIKYIYTMLNLDYISNYLEMYSEESSRSILGRITDLVSYTFFIYVLYDGIKEQKTKPIDNLFVFAVLLNVIFAQSSGLFARVIYYMTAFMSIYISRVMIEDEQIKKGFSYIIFSCYVILFIYRTGKYGASFLTSGYYLMF